MAVGQFAGEALPMAPGAPNPDQRRNPQRRAGKVVIVGGDLRLGSPMPSVTRYQGKPCSGVEKGQK